MPDGCGYLFNQVRFLSSSSESRNAWACDSSLLTRSLSWCITEPRTWHSHATLFHIWNRSPRRPHILTQKHDFNLRKNFGDLFHFDHWDEVSRHPSQARCMSKLRRVIGLVGGQMVSTSVSQSLIFYDSDDITDYFLSPFPLRLSSSLLFSL